MKITANEGLIGGIGILATAAATNDLKALPLVALPLVGAAVLRRSGWFIQNISQLLARIDYDETTGKPIVGKFLEMLPVTETGLVLAPRARQEPKEEQPKRSSKLLERVGGLLEDIDNRFSGTFEPQAVIQGKPQEMFEPLGRVKPTIIDQEAKQPSKPAERVKPPVELQKSAVIDVLTLCDGLNKAVDLYPHIFFAGPSGTGKTMLAQLMVSRRIGEFVILDPKRPKGWDAPKWGGLPYVSRDKVTASFKPMVDAMKAVVKEMDYRYQHQEDRSEPYPTLTVVLDEALDCIEESPELATLYNRIVSIGREVGIRLVLLAITDRAGALGFEGKADALRSFAWVRLGKFALNVLPELRERGPNVYQWACADLYGGWTPFANEQSLDLLQSVKSPVEKAWSGVKYNCQVSQKDDPGQTIPMRALPPAQVDDLFAQLMAMAPKTLASRPELALAARKKVDSRTLEGQVEGRPEGQPEGEVEDDLPKAEGALERQRRLGKALADQRRKVPEAHLPQLAKCIDLFFKNGRQPTLAIKEVYGFDGGRRYSVLRDYLYAAAEYKDGVQRK